MANDTRTYLMSSSAYSRNGETSKQEDQHAADQASNKHLRRRYVYCFEVKSTEFTELVHESTEKQKTRHRCASDRVAL